MIEKSNESVIYVDIKDHKRLQVDFPEANRVLYIPREDSMFDVIYHYENLWKKKVFFVIPQEITKMGLPKPKLLEHLHLNATRVCNFITNKSKTKIYSVFALDKIDFPPNEEIKELLSTGVLKFFYSVKEMYVYQLNNKLVWIIGPDVENETEIIYHLRTDRPDLLPESRKQYGFDNRGFIVGKTKYELEVGKYRIFSKDIPTEYPIKNVRTGLNYNRSVIWAHTFDLDTI